MAVGATWSIAVGVLIFIIAIITAIIFYYRYNKVSLIVFIASISTYIFAVFYTWDVFQLNKNYVMLLLLISTIIMFLLARYFGNYNLKASKLHTSLSEKER